MDSRSEVKEFLASRRARVTPEAAALLAGVSVDYYVRLERGNLHGVSEQASTRWNPARCSAVAARRSVRLRRQAWWDRHKH